MKILLVDAFDSFVHTIKQYLAAAGATPEVVRSDELTPRDVLRRRPDGIVLGPGPGHPIVSGHVEILRAVAGRIPVLGVCLGHQAVGLAFGHEVRAAGHLMHGKTSRISHDGKGLFAGVPPEFLATRYHSLVVTPDTDSGELLVTARDADDKYVMGLRHRRFPIESVQFHPESISTEHGDRMIRNFLDTCRTSAAAAVQPAEHLVGIA